MGEKRIILLNHFKRFYVTLNKIIISYPWLKVNFVPCSEQGTHYNNSHVIFLNQLEPTSKKEGHFNHIRR